MKNYPAVSTALKEEHALECKPELVIDWNMNRYYKPVSSNTPAEIDAGFDIEIFPIESIVEPLRPTKGINVARVGSGTISDDYFGVNFKNNGRYYLADHDDRTREDISSDDTGEDDDADDSENRGDYYVYRYWTSPDASDAGTGALANCKPQVVYDASIAVNKIVVTFENSWASPLNFSVQTTNVASPIDTDWTEVANQGNVPAWKATGQLILFWDGTDWQNGTRSDNADKSPKTTTLRGIRVVVTALEGGYKKTEDGSAVHSDFLDYVSGVPVTTQTNGKDARFDLIEIGARLEVDLSPYLIDVSDTIEISDVSQFYPLGQVTTNQSAVHLSNLYKSGSAWVPGLFNADNASSPYKNYIEENAEMTLRYHYYKDDGSFVGTVHQFKMYTETWVGQETDSVNVDLSDHSKFFNEGTIRPAMWEDLTVPEIVWRLLDSVGFSNYHIDRDADRVTEHKIPVFWTTGESSLWEVLNELAQASQTAIYFDGSGTLQVKTRDFAFSANDTPVWDLTAVSAPTKLADIAHDGLRQTTEFQPNHFRVIYKSTDWAPGNRGIPTMQKVWEPDGTVVLRSSVLQKDLLSSDDFIVLSQKDVKLWPYRGIVNVEGELITYKGKEFVYYTGDNAETKHTVVIETFDDSEGRNMETPWQHRHLNHFTGKLKVVERGTWNSTDRDHFVEANGYSVRNIINGTHHDNVTGFKHLRTRSRVQLTGNKRMKDYKDILVATRGDTDDTAFYYYGTKFRFNKGRPQQFAGMVIHNAGNTEDGYYIEFTPSKNLSGKERKSRQDLILYSRVAGKDKRIGEQAVPIGENIDYEVDVAYSVVGSDHKISVWLNGKNVLSKTISGANKNAANGKFGVFARGKTNVEFEYLYAIKEQEDEPPDDFSFLNKMERAYTGQQMDREWTFRWKKNKRRVKKKTNDPKHRVNTAFLDEFGPFVHEIREFKVKFDPFPVLHSRLYNTNDWSAAILDYRASPFYAHFTVANTARYNAVLNGDDTISFPGTTDPVAQMLTVLGRALVIKDDSDVVAKNDDQIKRRGRIESELSSDWIQSKHMAEDLTNWMSEHFSYGNDTLDVTIFGNPLIEVGDVVTVNFLARHINDDYFVVNTTNTFEQGLSTTMTLRRRHAP